MRRINLLPPEERRWRPFGGLQLPSEGARNVLAVAGAALVVLMAGLYLVYAIRIGNIEEEIGVLDDQISDRQQRVAELEPYRELQASLEAKEPVADGIFRTRFDWAGFLEGLAFVIPETTSLNSFEAQASQVDVNARSGEILTPPGSITFDGIAIADYRNVADFVVNMEALPYMRNAELESAELDRETYQEPAINFEVSSGLVTRVGANGEEVPLDVEAGDGGQ